MSNPFFFPGGQNSYIPAYATDLLIEYSRNVDSFTVNKIAGRRTTDKMQGFWPKMENQAQARLIATQDFEWALGADRPVYKFADRAQWVSYTTRRHNQSVALDNLELLQAAWDLKAQVARQNAQSLMTLRTYNVVNLLTTSSNWPTNNTGVCNTINGSQGYWGASSGTPCKSSVFAALQAIDKATLATCDFNNFQICMNPVAATTLSTSQEFTTFLEQNPVSAQIWEGKGEWGINTYGLSAYLFGLEVRVVRDVEITNQVGSSTTTASFIFPDTSAVICAKPGKIVGGGGMAGFSTVELIMMQDLEAEEIPDILNKRTIVSLTDNYVAMLVAGEAGYLITSILAS